MVREDSGYKVLRPNDDLQKRKEYWEIAKGLQKVDGLETSQYLETIIEDTINDIYGTKTAEKKLEEYYSELHVESPEYKSREADLVSARITVCLEKGDFKFSPIMLRSIHKDLFQDILPYTWVGTFRLVNITKDEKILNGKSVEYANWDSIQDYLKYLRNLGVEINNNPFKQHSDWFRDALVRSNYSNLEEGIYPDFLYLNLFFENILMNAGHDLDSLNLKGVNNENSG